MNVTPSNKIRDIVVQVGVGEHTPHTLARAYVDEIPSIEELRFVDLNPERLSAVEATCNALNRETGRNVKVTVCTDYKEALQDATVVGLSFGVAYPQSVLDDYACADKHGVPMVEAETIGIGGGLQGIRHLKVAMPIMDEMARVCPDAWCVVSTNPIRHLADYAVRYAGLKKSMGLCHGVVGTLHYLEKAIGLQHGTLDCIVAGANHHFWYLKIWDRQTGRDFYPELEKILKDRPLDGEMSRAVFPVFGLYPGNGPSHVPDAFGFFALETWKKYDLHHCISMKHYDPFQDYMKKDVTAEEIEARKKNPTQGNKRWTDYMWAIRDGRMDVKEYMAQLDESFGPEDADKEFRSLFKTDRLYYSPSLNIRNGSAVPNLPEDAIVEIPGVSNRTGAYPLAVGPLPDPVAELVRRQVVLQKLHVDAAAKGSRQILNQALLLDPTIKNIDSGMAFLDEALAKGSRYYPEFR